MIYVTTPGKVSLIPDTICSGDKLVLFYKASEKIDIVALDFLYSKAVPIVYLAVKTDSDMLVCTGALFMQVKEGITILDEDIPSPSDDIANKIRTVFADKAAAEPEAEYTSASKSVSAEKYETKPNVMNTVNSESYHKSDTATMGRSNVSSPVGVGPGDTKYHGSSLMKERSRLNAAIKNQQGKSMADAIHEDAGRIFSSPPGNLE